MVSYYLYYPFSILLKFLLRNLGDEIGIRHSFYFKKILFGYSDIDFSIYSKTNANPQDYEKIKSRHSICKKLIPICGEINFFEEEGIKYLGGLTNPCEVSRDPLLDRLVQTRLRPTEAQRNIYLLHVIESDKKNLKKSLLRRSKKLSYCMGLLSPEEKLKKEDLTSVTSFINYLKKNVLKEDVDLITDYLRYVLEGSTKKTSGILNLKDCLDIEWDKFKKLKEDRSIRDELIIECIKWEIWGIYTHLPFLEDRTLALSHVLVLNEVLESLTPNYKNEMSYIEQRLNEQI